MFSNSCYRKLSVVIAIQNYRFLHFFVKWLVGLGCVKFFTWCNAKSAIQNANNFTHPGKHMVGATSQSRRLEYIAISKSLLPMNERFMRKTLHTPLSEIS